MNYRTIYLALILIAFGISSCSGQSRERQSGKSDAFPTDQKVVKSEAEWKSQLDSFVFYVTREKGTERAFTGKYWDHKQEGTYICTNCQLPLFSSDSKYRSGTGWPSYYEPVNEVNVAEAVDMSYGVKLTEILCARCDSHLGHVFNDGPKPTGLRYCVNSISLDFEPKMEKQ